MSKDTSELLACFDETGNEIEPHTRAEVHQKPYRFWHAVTNVWVINPDGKILCSKRSTDNEGNPNKWQTYVGGHVAKGENFKQNVVREINEELGLNLSDGRLVCLQKERSENYKHITVMFAFYLNQALTQFNFKDGEVGATQWLNFDEYLADKNTNPDNWCNLMTEKTYKKILKHKL